jgi:hypothetical protein
MKKQTGQSDAKIVIYSRIDPHTVKSLDQIRETMKPTPTRAQMIDLAVAEFVERQAKPKQQNPGQ